MCCCHTVEVLCSNVRRQGRNARAVCGIAMTLLRQAEQGGHAWIYGGAMRCLEGKALHASVTPTQLSKRYVIRRVVLVSGSECVKWEGLKEGDW